MATMADLSSSTTSTSRRPTQMRHCASSPCASPTPRQQQPLAFPRRPMHGDRGRCGGVHALHLPPPASMWPRLALHRHGRQVPPLRGCRVGRAMAEWPLTSGARALSTLDFVSCRC
jgi:hypothetical protein